VSLLLLAWHFFILSLVAFGAATSVVPDLHRVLVESAHVMSDAEFAGLFAMSQAAPGTNVMFVTVLGWRVAGLAGALVSTVAFCSPTALLALAVERVSKRHRQARWHVSIRRALIPITVGLLLSTGYVLGKNVLTPGGVALVLAATGVLTWTRLSPLWITALGGILGMVGLV
jgi:chromate transporter